MSWCKNISQCRHLVNQTDPNISTKMKYFCLIVIFYQSSAKIGKTKNAYLALNNTYLVGTKSSKSLFLWIPKKKNPHYISKSFRHLKIFYVENLFLSFCCVCWTYIYQENGNIFCYYFMSENWLVDLFPYLENVHTSMIFNLKWWYATLECVTKDLSSDKQTCI